jgi:hypothetical protein
MEKTASVMSVSECQNVWVWECVWVRGGWECVSDSVGANVWVCWVESVSPSSTQTKKLVPDISLIAMIVIGSRFLYLDKSRCSVVVWCSMTCRNGCCYGDQNTWNTFLVSEKNNRHWIIWWNREKNEQKTEQIRSNSRMFECECETTGQIADNNR